MRSVTVLAMGKLKEKFYLDAVREYEKRLSGYCRFSLTELPEHRLPDNPSQAQIDEGLRREAELILARIPKGAWFCVLTPEGEKLSSEALARTIDAVSLRKTSQLCFLLGSSFGIDPAVKARADLRLSFSDMTFPHHLARVMLLEQLYRAENILAGTRYHK